MFNSYADPGPAIVIRKRWPWPKAALFIAGLCVVLWALGWVCAASAAEPVRWVIWDTGSDKPYHPHKFTSATACNTDIAGIKDGSGKRLACVKILKTAGE